MKKLFKYIAGYPMIKKLFLILVTAGIPFIYSARLTYVPDSTVIKEIEKIDNEFRGNLGVYIKQFGGEILAQYNTDRRWYMASTIKVLLAIAVLQKVEAGELSLDDKVTLEISDLVDGSGDLMYKKPGTSYTIRELLERMIKVSDSVASDMLIRLLREDIFNKHVNEHIIDEGVGHITSILQVRYDAYSELHASAVNLSNLDIIKLKSFTSMNSRLNEFVRIASIDKSKLKAKSIPEAFERYYERGLNSCRPESLATVLERLAGGEYLSINNTNLLLDIMKGVTTGDRRIRAGMPTGTVYAQKTGTQIARAVDVGIIYPPYNQQPIIITVFAERFSSSREAEIAFKKIGKVITKYWLK
ncbi:MAG: serine hydrolase [Ignavibacteriaceae bacterium]